MYITPPIIAAAEEIHIRPRHHHLAAVTSTHPTHASRQGRRQRNPQPNLDPVNQSVRLIHTDLPFAEEIKKCGGARNTTRRAVIKSPNVNSIFCLSFMRDIITTETFPSLWGVHPTRWPGPTLGGWRGHQRRPDQVTTTDFHAALSEGNHFSGHARTLTLL
jgi:hypothetical protein